MAGNALRPDALATDRNALAPSVLPDGSPDPNATEGWTQLYRNLTSPTDWNAVGSGYASALLMGTTAPGMRGLQAHPPEFSRWFGGSKVVDAHGAPLVVYHGT